MANNYQENGIRMYVDTDANSISRCIRSFANTHSADVRAVPQYDEFGRTAYADTKMAWILSGQAGIINGLRYPMHGRYTGWEILVAILEGGYSGQNEVILNAAGDPNPFHNLTLRCSMEYRKKMEDALRGRFICSAGEQIDYSA